MGSRANYAVVGNDGVELFYAHSGATTLLGDLAAGPAAVIGFVREQRPVEHWMNDIWCEGAALIDMTAPLTPVPGRGVLSSDDTGPDLGVHLDVAAREVGFWTAVTFKGAVDELAACWQGRRFEFWEDRHEEQARRCGGDFRMFPF